MKRRKPILLTLGAIGLLTIGLAWGQRPAWDQKAAEAKVRGLLAIENGQTRPWDRIAWETDPNAAALRAQRENKPLFVFFYLKKNVGPADAPC
jgi:hypothetical protein